MAWTSGYETETGLVRRSYVLSDVQVVSVYFSVELIVMGSEGSRFSVLVMPMLEVSKPRVFSCTPANIYSPSLFTWVILEKLLFGALLELFFTLC